MNKLYQTFLSTNKRYGLISPGDRVLCCVSGGADSVALLHMLVMNRTELGIEIFAVHVNHGLRKTAERDEAFVRELCRKLEVPLAVEHVKVQEGASLEACARMVRYQAFFRIFDEFGCNKVATAHTMNDNAKTVLFHLARGSGLSGLCGIPVSRENVIRPMLDCSRTDVLEYLREFQISHCEDETNAELTFSRNRIRNRVLPELDLAHFGAYSAIHRASRLLSTDADYFEAQIDELTKDVSVSCGEVRYKIDELSAMHDAIQTRLILRLAQIAVGSLDYRLEYQHILNIKTLLENSSPSAEFSFPDGLLVRRAYEQIVFFTKKDDEMSPVVLEDGRSYRFGRYSVSCSFLKPQKVHENYTLYQLDFDKIEHGLLLRSRAVGDQIRLPKRNKKTIKKLMIEEKTEKQLRDSIPIVSDGDRVVLAHGFGVDETYCATEHSKKIYIEIGLCEK